jgi:hypothetical protein
MHIYPIAGRLRDVAHQAKRFARTCPINPADAKVTLRDARPVERGSQIVYMWMAISDEKVTE